MNNRKKDKQSIILNCFSRGGSNLLWNMFLSHPDVCSPNRETLEIFDINLRVPKLSGLKTLLHTKDFRFFDQWNLNQRETASISTKKYIKEKLFEMKLSTNVHDDMKFKYENVEYNLDEIRKSRIVIKNNNGLIFLTDLFREIYSNPIFFALVRHPAALYESHLRRRTPASKTVESFICFYRIIVSKMLEDFQSVKKYHIIKFEEIIRDPLNLIEKIYQLSNLDISKIDKFRFRAKPYTHRGGEHFSKIPAYKHYWFKKSDVTSFLEPNVNKYQLESLKNETIKKINRSLEYEISKLGYK